eukprot:6952017-Alexandrium_andersonii.AAC.1
MADWISEASDRWFSSTVDQLIAERRPVLLARKVALPQDAAPDLDVVEVPGGVRASSHPMDPRSRIDWQRSASVW